jgi:peptidoglycan/xylan/chitin deacetylase (PgdA/CDA1 family)
MNTASQASTEVSRYLTYHEITPTASRYLYSVSAQQFGQHVKKLADTHASSMISGDPARITFDDGHASQFEYAAPVLESAAMKATFFVTVGWTGTRDGYMSWAQLAELSSSGHEVQSHGWSHALLTQCRERDLSNELVRSKQDLEDHLGKSVDAISAPGGRCNSRVLEACEKAGYRRVFLSDPWMVRKEKFGMNVSGRWMVTHHMDANKIAKLLAGKGLGLHILHAKHVVKESSKAVLGDRVYQSLWRRLSRKKESLEGVAEETDSAKHS